MDKCVWMVCVTGGAHPSLPQPRLGMFYLIIGYYYWPYSSIDAINDGARRERAERANRARRQSAPDSGIVITCIHVIMIARYMINSYS